MFFWGRQYNILLERVNVTPREMEAWNHTPSCAIIMATGGYHYYRCLLLNETLRNLPNKCKLFNHIIVELCAAAVYWLYTAAVIQRDERKKENLFNPLTRGEF